MGRPRVHVSEDFVGRVRRASLGLPLIYSDGNAKKCKRKSTLSDAFSFTLFNL